MLLRPRASIATAGLPLLVALLIAFLLVTPIDGADATRHLVHLDANETGDAFTYDPVSGSWSREVSDSNGGFTQQSQGSWSPGWSVVRADFNTDALTDFFLFNAATGAWAKMLNDGSGFTTESNGTWGTTWVRHAMELDGDGITDIFVYDPATGVWFKCLSTPTGFTYIRGGWNTQWETYIANFNGDDFDDLFLINRTTGRWFWALGENGPGFAYPVSETWFPWWALYPGDFNGDGLTDLLLHDPVTGTYFTGLTTETGFTYEQGGWSLGWTPSVMELNGDGSDDLFLHAPDTGAWFQMMSDGAGHFASAGGETWSLGWQLRPTDLNGDGREDLVLYDPLSGGQYQARNLVDGSFAYNNGTWSPGLKVITQRPVRPECAAFVNFSSTNFPAAGGVITGQVVTTAPDCAWSFGPGVRPFLFPFAGTGTTPVVAMTGTTFNPRSFQFQFANQQISMTQTGEVDSGQLGFDVVRCGGAKTGSNIMACSVTQHPGSNPGSTGMNVTVDLSVFGQSATRGLQYIIAGEWDLDLTVPAGFPPGIVMLTFTITDAQGRVGTGTAPLLIQ